MLIRLILLAVIVWIIYRLIKGYSKSLAKEESKGSRQIGEDMVRCAHCGVHVPKSEGLFVEGKVFCSEAHRKLEK